MILTVDDEPAILMGLSAVLENAGFEVRTATGPAEALKLLATAEPELIISDVMMPDMDGFAFKAAVDASWPNRHTPFLFLSSMTDAEYVIRGLDAGAWDYLSKPLLSSVLIAKVRNVLAQRSRFMVPSFQGELAELPLPQLLDFTMLKEITGELELEGGSGARSVVPLHNGKVAEQDRAALERRFPEGIPGRFVLRIPPPDWSQLVPRQRTAAAPGPKPMGKLSGVRLGERLLSIQTEVAGHPRPQVVTIVVHNGRVMLKRAIPAVGDTAAMELQILAQHRQIEEELRGKVAALAGRGGDGATTSATSAAAGAGEDTVAMQSDDEAFRRDLEAGFERYRAGDLAGAIAVWEEADRRKPGDRILATNLQTLRIKLGQIPAT